MQSGYVYDIFFFFQAEDGIRDVAVTGVQTCALPISQETLAQFMSAVKANDLERMRTLWGSERGLASGHLKSTDVNQRLAVLQIYLNHVGYRVVEGPLPVPNKEDRRLLRVELQRSTSCTVVVPIELARTKEGRWLVVGTDLASIPNPAAACKS